MLEAKAKDQIWLFLTEQIKTEQIWLFRYMAHGVTENNILNYFVNAKVGIALNLVLNFERN